MARRTMLLRATLHIALAAPLVAAGLGSPVFAGLIPGGGPQRSDCLVEANVQGITNPSAQVRSNRIVMCTDGDPCDTDGVCGDNHCTLKVAVCVNQVDPNLPTCTPPSGLRHLKVNSRLLAGVPATMSGSACGSFVDIPLVIKVRPNGKQLPGKVALSANAIAEKGSSPARDRDKYVLQCLPATACPSGASPTTTTTLPGAQMTTVTVGPNGDFSFSPRTVTIHVGDTVRWRWGSGGHDVVSGSGGTADDKFCSPNDQNCGGANLLSSGTVYDHTFTTAGTFPYFCSVHVNLGMTGTVVVEP